MPLQETLKHCLVQSLGGLLVPTGLFETSECLWRVWGSILNRVFPLLLSCWGFSALGLGDLLNVSPAPGSCCSSTAQLDLLHVFSAPGADP